MRRVRKTVAAYFAARYRRPFEGDWWIGPAGAGWVAVLEPEWGTEGEDELELARQLSDVRKGRHYAINFHDDYPKVVVYERGAEIGGLAAWPDDLLVHLGVELSWLRPLREIDAADLVLSPPPPSGRAGERVLHDATVRQWEHAFEHDTFVYDGIAPNEADQADLCRALSESSRGVRAMAAKLLGASQLLPDEKPPIITALRERLVVEIDGEVRAALTEALECLER